MGVGSWVLDPDHDFVVFESWSIAEGLYVGPVLQRRHPSLGSTRGLGTRKAIDFQVLRLREASREGKRRGEGGLGEVREGGRAKREGWRRKIEKYIEIVVDRKF